MYVLVIKHTLKFVILFKPEWKLIFYLFRSEGLPTKISSLMCKVNLYWSGVYIWWIIIPYDLFPSFANMYNSNHVAICQS